jgi:hypothetical protein
MIYGPSSSSGTSSITVLAGTLGAGYLSRLAGIIPVLAVQGGGYVVAGLAMLVWIKEEPGEPADAGALSQGEPALVAADG